MSRFATYPFSAASMCDEKAAARARSSAGDVSLYSLSARRKGGRNACASSSPAYNPQGVRSHLEMRLHPARAMPCHWKRRGPSRARRRPFRECSTRALGPDQVQAGASVVRARARVLLVARRVAQVIPVRKVRLATRTMDTVKGTSVHAAEDARFGDVSDFGSGTSASSHDESAVLSYLGSGSATANAVAGPSSFTESIGPAQPDQAPVRFDFLSNTSSSSSFVESPISSYQLPTLPMPSSGPPTPTVADFASAEHERERERNRPHTISVASVSANSTSYSRGAIWPPGFSGMLSLRSSSPIPPSAVDG